MGLLSPRTAPPTPEPHPEPGRHQSLALAHLLGRLRSAGGVKHRILDLGPATGGNVSFFARYPCTLQIADLHQSLRSHLASGQAGRRDAFRQLLLRELARTGSVDQILAWDLLNYLTAEEVAMLGERLLAHCHDGSLVYALIATRKEIPQSPMRFEILESNLLAYDLESRLTRPSPQYKEPDLARMLPAFEVEATFLLRNGLQEYVLSRRDTGGGA